jgi:putative Mn2+ efflux pump MntP
LIGGNMIRESLSKEEDDEADASLSFAAMLLLAVATSIDALAVGVTFAFLQVNVWLAIALIGVITFLLSAVGVKLGNLFGMRYKKKAEFAGGAVLILLGCKILLEHLGLLPW